MYEVTAETGFSSGHYLRNYHDKCENLHGPNYKVKVAVVGKSLDQTGLLFDSRRDPELHSPRLLISFARSRQNWMQAITSSGSSVMSADIISSLLAASRSHLQSCR